MVRDEAIAFPVLSLSPTNSTTFSYSTDAHTHTPTHMYTL